MADMPAVVLEVGVREVLCRRPEDMPRKKNNEREERNNRNNDSSMMNTRTDTT